MCERYVAFVKECGLEVLKWRDKRLTKDFAMYAQTYWYLKAHLLIYNTCELSFHDLAIILFFSLKR